MDAKLNITFAGQNGDLKDLISFDASDEDIKGWAVEAVRSGSVPGIDAQEANFTDFIVDRFPAKEDLPARVILRPKTPFGS